MSRTTPWLALLLVATAACSDGDGPVETPLSRPFDDAFTMAIPALRQLTVAPDQTALPPGTTEAAASEMLDPSEIPEEYQDRLRSSIVTVSSWADAGIANDHEVAYGMAYGRSRGNFYRNVVSTTLRYRGSTIATVTAEESDWSFFRLPVHDWGETALARIGVTGNCGHEVHVTSRHEAELRLLASTRIFVLASSVTSNTDSYIQPACSGGGGAGGGLDEEWYICYWIDHYDSNGEFLFRQDLGCSEINVF